MAVPFIFYARPEKSLSVGKGKSGMAIFLMCYTVLSSQELAMWLALLKEAKDERQRMQVQANRKEGCSWQALANGHRKYDPMRKAWRICREAQSEDLVLQGSL